MSKILNKIFDRDLYNTVKAERYELDQNGNKNMYNIGQLEGLAEQGNEEAKAIVDKVNNEVDEMLKKMDSGNYLFKTFNEYILEMARLTEEASKQRDEVEAKHDKAEKAWKEARSAINVSDSWTSARKTEYLLANEEYDKSCIGIYNDLKQKLTALKSAFVLQMPYGRSRLCNLPRPLCCCRTLPYLFPARSHNVQMHGRYPRLPAHPILLSSLYFLRSIIILSFLI